MDLDKEIVLQDLQNFCKVAHESDQIPEQLEKYLVHVAKTGDTLYSWSELKPLIKRKIELISNEFNERFPYEAVPNASNRFQMFKPFQFNEMCQLIIETIDSFYGAPFTIQRLCELLTCPYKHYKRTDKFMRALEKNVLVVSTAEPRSESELNEYCQKQKNATFYSSSSSSLYVEASASHSTYVNGITEIETQSITAKYTISGDTTHPAPLQQLDSFTTVFASTPSTPLDVVSDIQTYDNRSSPSSSGSSDSNSPQSAGSPVNVTNERNELNGETVAETHFPAQTETELSQKISDQLPEVVEPNFDIEQDKVNQTDQIEVVSETESTNQTEQNSVSEIANTSESVTEIVSKTTQENINSEENLIVESVAVRVFDPQTEDTVSKETPRKRVRRDSDAEDCDSGTDIPEKMSKLDAEEVQQRESDNKENENVVTPIVSDFTEPECASIQEANETPVSELESTEISSEVAKSDNNLMSAEPETVSAETIDPDVKPEICSESESKEATKTETAENI